jgi:hypothetical protein
MRRQNKTQIKKFGKITTKGIILTTTIRTECSALLDSIYIATIISFKNCFKNHRRILYAGLPLWKKCNES